MNKKIKYGTVEIPAEDFKDENALIRISMMIPLTVYKDFKRLSLNEEFGGKYQLLIRQVLEDYIEKSKAAAKPAKRRA